MLNADVLRKTGPEVSQFGPATPTGGGTQLQAGQGLRALEVV